jgi:hypothetical protein
MKPPRFSLRSWLILTACLAAFLYWRDRPRQMANRFVALMEAGDYLAAKAMFGEQVGRWNKPLIMDEWKAFRKRQSAADWLRGRCYVSIIGNRDEWRYVSLVVATATGMRPVGDWQITHAPPNWPREVANAYSPPSRRSK